MAISDKDFLWVGIAIFLWVLYQSVTGRFIYKRGAARREENPPVFWGAMAFEGLFSLSCIGSGLHLTSLSLAAFGLFVLIDVGVVVWVIAGGVRRMLKYPWCLWRHFSSDKPREAALELQSFLAKHPGDRETLFLLAGAYEQAGEGVAAWDLYTELARGKDRWGRGAGEFLRKRGSGGGLREARGKEIG